MTRKEVESLFKTHYTQMYHLALTLLFDEAESKDVVSDVFTSLLSGKAASKREQGTPPLPCPPSQAPQTLTPDLRLPL